MKRITDPSFKYVNAANTSIADTFKRIRKEQQRSEQSAAKPVANNVTVLVKPKIRSK